MEAVIRHLLFDLDNTLYPASSALGAEFERRVAFFVADYLRLSPEKAAAMRREGVRRHGTSMRWLMEEHGMRDPEAYIDFVHPANVGDFIPRDETLRPLLGAIPIPKSILTNSPMRHAERVLGHLDVRDLFERVLDIEHFGYRGKPSRETFEAGLREIGVPSTEVLFIDDNRSNLESFRAIGGRVLLVDEAGAFGDGLPGIRGIRELPGYLAVSGA